MRFYRALLRLYPASFRREYGGEMMAIVQRRLRDTGAAGALMFWPGVILETIGGAAAVHGDILRQDLRYALRTLVHAPAFAATAMLVIGLGVGANTAAFTVTDFVLLRPLPFPEPDRLVKLWQASPGYVRFEQSPENYRDWKRLSHSFTSMGALWVTAANLMAEGGEPQRVPGAAVTWDLLPTLGVAPLLGRTFTEAEDREGAAGTIILSHSLWRSLFGGAPDVLGRRLTLDDQPFVVIGVMPPTFTFPSARTGFWRPIQLSPSDTDRTNTYLQIAARLKPGVSIEQARAEMTAISARMAAAFPKENRETTAAVIRMRDEVPRQSRLLLLALSGAALCVLLIVCANLSSLLIARALARRREMAVRTAIGAGRDRLIRQLATESAVLALAGGALGIAVAQLAIPLLARLAPVNLPTTAAPAIDARVLLFALGLTTLTGIAFGLLPAVRVARGADAAGLREGGRGGTRRDRLRGALVVTEVAASIVLLAAAGLLIRALHTVERVDPGFRPDNVLAVHTTLAWPKYAPTEKRAVFYTRVLSEVRALPGVTSAVYVSGLPMIARGGIWNVEFAGDDGSATREQRAVSVRYTTPGFFRTLDVPLLQGRDVSDADTGTSEKVAIVSESFARRFWPGGDAIGRRFSVAFFERTIVGIAADVRVRGLEATSEPQVYLPYRQIPDGWMSTYAPGDLAIRTTLPPGQLAPAVRAIIRRVDPLEPISDVGLLTDVVDRETAPRAGQVRVLGAFASIAVLLAVIGIHGLLMFAVSQRTQEFGVRVALGARPGDLAGMVLRQATALALAGGIIGLFLAYAAGRSLQALLAGIGPADPLTFAGILVFAVLMTLAGSATAVYRALHLNPVDALRAEA